MPTADISPAPPSGALSFSLKTSGNDINKTGQTAIDIIDIRRKAVEINLKEDILSQFHPKTGPRTLPTLLLYNERGLQLFEDVRACANAVLPQLHETNTHTHPHRSRISMSTT